MDRAHKPELIDEAAASLIEAAIYRMASSAPDVSDTETKQLELGLLYPCDELKELKDDAHTILIDVLEECAIRALNIMTGHGNVCPQLDDVD